jgi:hypothetical protein
MELMLSDYAGAIMVYENTCPNKLGLMSGLRGPTRFWSARTQHDLALFYYFVIVYKISIVYLNIEYKA